jgi:CRP-like cAMP-binding protein
MHLIDLLRTIDVFEHLSREDLEELSGRMHHRQVGADDSLCRAGETAEAMYIVLSGSIELTTPASDGRSAATRRLTAGDPLGEVALIARQPQPATATALVDSRVVVLDRDDFDSLVTTRPHVMRTMLVAVSRRAVQANRRLLTEEPSGADDTSRGCLCAVYSPSGGSGKTTLATRLAIRLAELMPRRVALVDLDLLLADAALQLDLTPERSLASLPEGELQHLDPHALNGYLVEHPSGLRVLVGATSPEQGERVTASHVRAALGVLRRQFLVTVIDAPSTFAEPTLAALETVDQVLMVCTPDLANLRDVRDCQRIFRQALHLDSKRVSYVLNRPLPSAGLTRAQFESALEQPMALEIRHAGELASKQVFARAIDRLAGELRGRVAAAANTLESAAAVDARRSRFGSNPLARLLRRAHVG